MNRTLSLMAGLFLILGSFASLNAETAIDISQLDRVTQELVLPPFLPGRAPP